MAKKAKKVFAVKGKKVLEFDMKNDKPKKDELTGALIGRSGTLRAPTFLIGDKMVTGFNEDLYAQVFGV